MCSTLTNKAQKKCWQHVGKAWEGLTEDRGDEKKIETTLAQHWQVGARHAEDRGDEKKMETTLAQQFDFVLQAMRAAQASRRQSVQNSPKRKASSDKVFFDGVPCARHPWFLGKVSASAGK